MPRKRRKSPEALILALALPLTENLSNRNAKRRLAKYGLTADQYAAMFVAQKGLCAICHSPERSERNDSHVSGLVIDHDHETGKVRGLLCSRCNSALGLFGDDRGNIQRAFRYLTHHPN